MSTGMNGMDQMRKEVKKYLETADDKTVKMIHAMLEVDAEADWWDTVPDEVKTGLEESMKQGDNGKALTHEEVKSKYPQWFTK